MSPIFDHARSADRAQPASSSALAPTPDRLHAREPENLPTRPHKLAGFASGTGRSSGSLLDEAAAALDYTPVGDLRDPDTLREIAGQYRERNARALALEAAAIEVNAAAHEAEMTRRRIARRQASLQRKAERGEKKDNRWANRPVKVEVDAAAWEAVKRAGLRHRRTIGFTVGNLVSRSVQEGVLPRNRPQPTSVRRFARLYVEDEPWARFRLIALDAHVSVGRLVGMLVEREARLIARGEER